jgi:hypothetical protein
LHSYGVGRCPRRIFTDAVHEAVKKWSFGQNDPLRIQPPHSPCLNVATSSPRQGPVPRARARNSVRHVAASRLLARRSRPAVPPSGPAEEARDLTGPRRSAYVSSESQSIGYSTVTLRLVPGIRLTDNDAAMAWQGSVPPRAAAPRRSPFPHHTLCPCVRILLADGNPPALPESRHLDRTVRTTTVIDLPRSPAPRFDLISSRRLFVS